MTDHSPSVTLRMISIFSLQGHFLCKKANLRLDFIFGEALRRARGVQNLICRGELNAWPAYEMG
jgi:hypothetical protein